MGDYFYTYVWPEMARGALKMKDKEIKEVANEPSWRQTAQNLREALGILTKERDHYRGEAAKARVEAAEARKDAQEWGLMGSKYERVRAEAQAAQEGYREARAQLWHAEDERDAERARARAAEEKTQALEAERDAARKERDASIRDSGLETDRANRAEKERDEQCKRADAALAESYRLRVDLENYARRETTCKRAAHILTQAGLVSVTPPKSVYWGWVDQLEEGPVRAAEVAKERDALSVELDAAKRARDVAECGAEAQARTAAILLRERDEARAALVKATEERDAAIRAFNLWREDCGAARILATCEIRDLSGIVLAGPRVSTGGMLSELLAVAQRRVERVEAERDALRRRAAQIAELLRAEGDADETP